MTGRTRYTPAVFAPAGRLQEAKQVNTPSIFRFSKILPLEMSTKMPQDVLLRPLII